MANADKILLEDVPDSDEDMTSASSITICVTSPTFVVDDSDIELKMDGWYLFEDENTR